MSAQRFEEVLAKHVAGDITAAAAGYREILQEQADHLPALANLGLILVQQSEQSKSALHEGIALLKRGLSLNPNQPNVHNSLGNAYVLADDEDKAKQHFLAAIKLNSQLLDPYLNLAALLKSRQELRQAINLLDTVESCFKSEPRYYIFISALCLDAGLLDKALVYAERAVELSPLELTAWYNRGNALYGLGRRIDAIKSFGEALKINPTHVESMINIGVALQDVGDFNKADMYFKSALSLRPESETALFNLGLSSENQRAYEKANEIYDRLYTRNPKYPNLRGRRQHVKSLMCAWETYDQARTELLSDIAKGLCPVVPFALLALTDNAQLQLRCAQSFSRKYYSGLSVFPGGVSENKKKHRIKVGYFSPDFKTHPLVFLAGGVFELHDRTQFEIYAFNIGNVKPDDPCNLRVRQAVDHYLAAEMLSDEVVLSMAHEIGLDIAVDLAGHTMGGRTRLFAAGLAPIQVNYLGYPGTMGMSAYTHIIADAVVIPESQALNYSEQVVRLPHTFQINDRSRKIGDCKARSAYGLPEAGLVLASFNTSNKINPGVFDTWCNILASESEAVLWMLGESEIQQQNLRREFQARGLETHRLIFADRMSYADHLARYAHVDLVLDTFPFNGGTSTSDALWGGAPVLTCVGEAFASRMSASLLKAVGLPELITDSLSAYRDLGIELVQNPNRIGVLKQRLANNRETCPLFDTELITRDIEYAYKQMVGSPKPNVD